MIRRYLRRDNPWEILAFAGMLFLPGLFLELQKSKQTASRLIDSPVRKSFRSQVVGISRTGAHIFGWVAIAFSFLCSSTFICASSRLRAVR